MRQTSTVSSSMFSLLLAGLCLVSCRADINVTDYVFWTKDGINQWHTFFPTRAIKEELLTIVTAKKVLLPDIRRDLKKIITFQYQELKTAKKVMEGTDAKGCVRGLSRFLYQAVQKEQNGYRECTADASKKLAILKANLNRVNTSYQRSYERALGGIDACAKTYRNKDSVGRLRSCVEFMNNAYFTAANNTQTSLSPSPAMSYIKDNVVQCASSAAENVAAEGSQFLKKLVSCASLSGSVDPVTYDHELSQWRGYNDTLATQFSESQSRNIYQVRAVENVLTYFYNLKKEALQTYVIEPRDLSFYQDKVHSYLDEYYNAVTTTSLDNPGDNQCADYAINRLQTTSDSVAQLALSYDEKVVNDTKNLMSNTYDNFVYINTLLPTAGNVALLNCYSLGYVFAPNTVLDCFKLKSSGFDVEYIERNGIINNNLETLKKYTHNFNSYTELPWGEVENQELLLFADIVLYNLQRCLYKSSGTTFEVTTPKTSTTTYDKTTEDPLITTTESWESTTEPPIATEEPSATTEEPSITTVAPTTAEESSTTTEEPSTTKE